MANLSIPVRLYIYQRKHFFFKKQKSFPCPISFPTAPSLPGLEPPSIFEKFSDAKMI